MYALEAALQDHEAGRFDLARAAYLAILAETPDSAEALHLFGVLEHQTGHHAAALPLLERATTLHPTNALYLGNLGSVLLALGRIDEAISAYRSSLTLAPGRSDTRFNLGVALEAAGHAWAALECFEQTLNGDTEHLPALLNTAIVLKKLGQTTAAAARFEAVLAHDPGNALADHHLAILTGGDRKRAPNGYLIHTFDAAAASFDRHLQDDLHYDSPARLVEMLRAHRADAEPWNVLDLGCGTGLTGAAIAPYAHHITGVDLSPKMLQYAAISGHYSRLVESELVAMMSEESGENFDVVLCADVFIYNGELTELFAQTARLLCTGGLFACSAEALDTPGETTREMKPYRLQASGRYAHASAYLSDLAERSGFDVARMDAAPARLEAGQPVMAWLMVLEKRST